MDMGVAIPAVGYIKRMGGRKVGRKEGRKELALDMTGDITVHAGRSVFTHGALRARLTSTL